MSLYRYSRWDGSQQLPAFDADDVLEALSDDLLAEGDVRRALQRLMQRGMRGTRGGDVQGLRRRIECAHSLRDLWHLRSEVFCTLGVALSQSQAEARRAQLNRHVPTRAPRTRWLRVE